MSKQVVIIHPDGTEEKCEGPFTLRAMQRVVGGTVEHVRVLDRIENDKFVYSVMYVDDEGRLKGNLLNPKATEIYRRNAEEQIKRGADAKFFDLDNAFIVGDALYFQGYTAMEVDALYEGIGE